MSYDRAAFARCDANIAHIDKIAHSKIVQYVVKVPAVSVDEVVTIL